MEKMKNELWLSSLEDSKENLQNNQFFNFDTSQNFESDFEMITHEEYYTQEKLSQVSLKDTSNYVAQGTNTKEKSHKLLQFLWSGSGRNIVTSDAGMYGELRESSLIQIFNYLYKECQLNEQSIICDIGSGRGCPNIVASYEKELGASVGLELGLLAYILAQKNKSVVLERDIETQIKNGEDPSKNSPSHKIAFINMDAGYIQTLYPVTHIFSFDAAMPGWLIFHLCKLFNCSKTTFCYCSFRPNLIEDFWLKGFKKKVISGSMSGSGEGRSCHVYLKHDWQSFSAQAFQTTNNLFNSFNEENNNLAYSSLNDSKFFFDHLLDPLNLLETVRIAYLPASFQLFLSNKQIEDWHSKRYSRSYSQEYQNHLKQARNQREAFLKEQTVNFDPLDNPFLNKSEYWIAHNKLYMNETKNAWNSIGLQYSDNKFFKILNNISPSYFFNNSDNSWLTFFEGKPLPRQILRNSTKDILVHQDWNKPYTAIENVLNYFNNQYNLDHILDNNASSNNILKAKSLENQSHPIQSNWRSTFDVNTPIYYVPNKHFLPDNELVQYIKEGKKTYLFNRIKKLLPIQWEAKQISKSLQTSISWIKCDKCGKWREIPDFYPKNEKNLIQQNTWECKMNIWDEKSKRIGSCKVTCDWEVYQSIYE